MQKGIDFIFKLSQLWPLISSVQPRLLCPLSVTVTALCSSLSLCSSDRGTVSQRKQQEVKEETPESQSHFFLVFPMQKGKSCSHSPCSGSTHRAPAALTHAPAALLRFTHSGVSTLTLSVLLSDLQRLVTIALELRELLSCTLLSSDFLLNFKFAGLGMETGLAWDTGSPVCDPALLSQSHCLRPVIPALRW